MYYDYQRWYDPSIGRFISQDPLPGWASNPQSLNHYVYVVNQPTGLTDPSGAVVEGLNSMTVCFGDGCPEVTISFSVNNVLVKVNISEISISTDEASYTFTVSGDNTFQFQEPTIGPGGARSVLKGQQFELRHLFEQFDKGQQPENTEYQKTIADQTTGKTFRFDSSYDNGRVKYLDEVKSGYVSGETYESKALEYQRIANQQGATLR